MDHFFFEEIFLGVKILISNDKKLINKICMENPAKLLAFPDLIQKSFAHFTMRNSNSSPSSKCSTIRFSIIH